MKDFSGIKDYQIVLLGFLIALGAIISTYLLSNGIIQFQKLQAQAITVTGSASQKVTSDFATWNGSFETRNANLKAGYAKLTADAAVIREFLLSNGIEASAIEFSPINSYAIYKRTPNGYETNEIQGYRLSQSVTVSSKDINKITEMSKGVAALIDKNVELNSNNVQYFVSNIDDIKIKMVGEATKNAKLRAESMVKSTKGRIGVMNSAKMGVFQIVPENSTEVSDYGINDTRSIEKKVVAVVNATFTVK